MTKKDGKDILSKSILSRRDSCSKKDTGTLACLIQEKSGAHRRKPGTAIVVPVAPPKGDLARACVVDDAEDRI